MSKISSETKQDLQERIRRLLGGYPDGLRQREIEELLHVEGRRLNNYLRDLEDEAAIYKDGMTWFISDVEPKVLRSVHLKAEQATLLYLAMRMFVKQSDKRVGMAETLLYQLADILADDAGVSEDMRDAAQELAQRPQEEGYEDIFRTLCRAYIHRLQVKIVYRPYRGEAFETVLSPYLIEPSAIGFASYVIGYSSAANAIRTHKIERIEHAQVIRHSTFTIPEDFPGLALLRNAWSIYYGEAVIRVVLRFHPDVARRVRETNWRTAYPPEDDPEMHGYVRVTFDVADTTDLKPWIRTWGANCEVLEPASLRAEMTGEARALAYLYGWQLKRGQDDHSKFNDIFGE
jgi:predicted DNA-binding transcriptional regulator YafY